MTTYEEIIEAARSVAGFKERTTESDEQYLKDLIRLVAVVDDSAWNKMSKQAQSWYNQAVRSVNGRLKLPECPGYIYASTVVPTPQPEPVKEGEVQSGQAAPTTIRRAHRTPGAIDAVRRTVIKHPDWTIEQIYSHLVRYGFPTISRGTVEVNVGDIKKTMKVAQEFGWTPPQKKQQEDQQETQQ